MNAFRFLSDKELNEHELGRMVYIRNLKIKLLDKTEELAELRREQKDRRDERR